jgi:hypothetical protein
MPLCMTCYDKKKGKVTSHSEYKQKQEDGRFAWTMIDFLMGQEKGKERKCY